MGQLGVCHSMECWNERTRALNPFLISFNAPKGNLLLRSTSRGGIGAGQEELEIYTFAPRKLCGRICVCWPQFYTACVNVIKLEISLMNSFLVSADIYFRMVCMRRS